VAGAQQNQPGYAVIRVADGEGNGIPYVLWVFWQPTIVTTPDGGAWSFFSAQPAGTEGVGNLGALYASRYDPEVHLWQPAQKVPGGEIQFGASAVVDGEGRVHLIYSDRTSVADEDFSTLVYVTSDGNGGWTEPVQVAPSETAGHQLSPNLAIDGSGGLHVIWQDQRNVTEEQRAANAAYADIFASDLVDGAWSEPVQVSPERQDAETNGSRPQLVADGDRLVATWSIYPGVTDADLASAVRIEWSTRPLDPAAAWAEPQALVEQQVVDDQPDQIGGRSIDIVAAPGGGTIAMYTRRTDETEIFVSVLATGETAWSEPAMVSTGNFGLYPAMAVAPDGTLVLVYENGLGEQVDVGGLAVAPGAGEAGPNTVVSPGEIGAQGRPGVTIDQDGGIWVIYYHQPRQDSGAVEVRVLRGAEIPTEAA
jgi:hypothetical protein